MTSQLRARLQQYPDAVGLGALALLALTVFWPLLLGGQAYFFGDLELYFYPLSEFWRRELTEGHLPLWNPYLSGGVPFAGNPQMGLLYPPALLLGLLPTITAISLGLVLHLWGSGAVFFLWMRHGKFRLGASAALLGAICWMLGGAFVSKTQFPNMLAALAYLPAALWATEALAQRPTLRAATVLGAVLGLQLLAAHAQISLYTIYFVLFYALWNWRVARSSLSKIALGLAFALSLALLLDAGQLLPVLENLRGADRQALSVETAPRFVLPIWAITNLFAPYLYGNPNWGTWTYHGGGNAWETACYLGVVPFLLAAWSLKRGKFWTFAALACLLLALGPAGGLYLVAFQFLPGLSRFHDAARFLLLGGLAFSVLAALGFQKLREFPKLRRLTPLVLLLVALDLGLYARSFYPLRDAARIAPSPRFVGSDDEFLKAHQGRVWTANPKTARGLLLHYGNYQLRTAAHDAIFDASPVPNRNIWNGVMEAGGYDPMAPAQTLARLKRLEIPPEATRFPRDYARQLGENNIRLLSIWRSQPPLPAPGLVEIYRGFQTIDGLKLFVYRNDFCPPRARWRNEGENWSAAKITSQDSNSIEVQVPPAATQVQLTDNFAPGWTAHEAGQKLEIKATPEGFRHVGLKPASGAGQRQVRFDYVPTTWKFGVFVSLCALCFVVAVGVATRRP